MAGRKAKSAKNVFRAVRASNCCPCFFWGVVLVLVGFLFLLEDLGQITLYGVRWWSVVLILIGLMKVTRGLY